MAVTPENLPRHELIGLNVEVVRCSDKNMEGLKGEVIDETQKTFKILTQNGEKTVPKAVSDFLFRLEQQKKQVKVEGKLLVGRPEERIGMKLPGKWGYIK